MSGKPTIRPSADDQSYFRPTSVSDKAMSRQLSKDEGSGCLAQDFHCIEHTSENRLVPTYECQIIIIRDVGLRSNPRDLFPEQSDEMSVCPLRWVQGEAIVHKIAKMSVLLCYFENILSKMACADVCGSVEDVPFVVAVMRYVLSNFNFRAVRNFHPTLPASSDFFVGRSKPAAIDRSDGDVFPKHDFGAQLQEVEIVVRDQPLVRSI
jgi:hypothetical protein